MVWTFFKYSFGYLATLVVLCLALSCGDSDDKKEEAPAATPAGPGGGSGNPPEETQAEQASAFAITDPIGPGNNITPNLTWEAVTDATQYTVVIASDAACDNAIYEAISSTHTHELEDALSEGSYYLCVSAHFEDGSILKAKNFGVSFNIDTTAPSAPTALLQSMFFAGLGRAMVGVQGMPEDRSDLQSIELHVSSSATPACDSASKFSVSTSVNENFTLIISGTPGGTAYTRLCIKDKAGNVENSKTLTVTYSNKHRIFMTSQLFIGDLTTDFMNINGGSSFSDGLTGADARCQALAKDAGLPNTWKALLSTSTVDAKDRFTFHGAIYDTSDLINPNMIASSGSDLWEASTTSLLSTIEFTETGEIYEAPITFPWTGTKADGTKDTNHCNDWTGGDFGTHGSGVLAGAEWLENSTLLCNGTNEARLFCVEQELEN